VKTEPVGDRQESSARGLPAGRLAAAIVAAVTILLVITAVAPVTTGFLALAQILLAHLALATAAVAVGLAIALRSRGLTVALAVLVIVGGLRLVLNGSLCRLRRP
jgi:small-conductance mechanosensitive channel